MEQPKDRFVWIHELHIIIGYNNIIYVQLTWSEPSNDGGKSIVGYFIEKREKKGVRWIPCNMHSVPEHRYKCIGLNSDVEYQFRIKAENEVGISEPSMVSKPMQPHDPIVPPQAPLGFKIVDQSASSVSLAWVAPAYDGGSPLIGFDQSKMTIHPELIFSTLWFQNVKNLLKLGMSKPNSKKFLSRLGHQTHNETSMMK